MNRLVLFLVFTSSVVLSAETKRPSWSQGLPEQKQIPVALTSKTEVISYSPDVDEMQADQPDIGFDAESFHNESMLPMQMAPLEPGYLPEPPVRYEVKEVSEADVVENKVIVVEEEIITEVVNEESEPIETKELVHSETTDIGVYSWQIIRQFPIKVSAVSISNRDSLLVKVIINNQGDVVAVDRVLVDTPISLIQTVERSIRRWKFASPETEGVVAPYLSRVFKVALTSR